MMQEREPLHPPPLSATNELWDVKPAVVSQGSHLLFQTAEPPLVNAQRFGFFLLFFLHLTSLKRCFFCSFSPILHSPFLPLCFLLPGDCC